MKIKVESRKNEMKMTNDRKSDNLGGGLDGQSETAAHEATTEAAYSGRELKTERAHSVVGPGALNVGSNPNVCRSVRRMWNSQIRTC